MGKIYETHRLQPAEKNLAKNGHENVAKSFYKRYKMMLRGQSKKIMVNIKLKNSLDRAKMKQKWNKNGTKMEQRWNKNEAKMEEKWSKNAAKMQPE